MYQTSLTQTNDQCGNEALLEVSSPEWNQHQDG
jgi:hypothetical protein